MIPDFDGNGYLPPAIHEASLVEIKKRFAITVARKRIFEQLKYLAKMLKSAGCKTLYLNGSYVTDKAVPGDYDAVWEYEGVDNTIDPVLRDGNRKAIKLKYGGDVFCRMPEIYGKDHVEYFQTDREGNAKGIIKIDLSRDL